MGRASGRPAHGGNDAMEMKRAGPWKGTDPFELAPAARFELATNRLTADCSTAELRRISVEARTGLEPVYTALQAAA